MIYLASKSQRRRELLAGLDIKFKVTVIPSLDESYPADTPADDVALYIAQKKAEGHRCIIDDDEEAIVITADTVVVLEEKVLGKPKDAAEAFAMLRALSGKRHHVITGVCITSASRQSSFKVSSEVEFAELSDSEISYYIERYRPFDKAGAYGIQEWIGFVGVRSINGSYFNVMGLPIQRLYAELKGYLGNPD